MKPLGMGLVGPGFVAAHHLDAVRRLGDVTVVAIAGSNAESAARRAAELGVGRAYGRYQDLIHSDEIQVVHNTTPTHLHFEVSMMALKAGKHVISDKPLALNSNQARELRDAALNAGVAHVLTFNYRGNPLVQHARQMLAGNECGATTFIHGHYLQDWMADPDVYSWRLDPDRGGASSALTDIGSHWCDLAEHVSGHRIQAVLADLSTVIAERNAPSRDALAFSKGESGSRIRVPVTTEDLASVLLRFDNGARGCFVVGQVLPGHKNDFQLEVSGRLASLKWRQEAANELWIGRHAQPSTLIPRDPSVLSGDARRYTLLPPGHQQGWSDAFFNIIADAYRWIRDGGAPDAKPEPVATFADGYRSHRIIEAILASHEAGGVWCPVNP